MKNKVLIQLIVPDIEEKFDLFIPINKKIGTVKNLIDLNNLSTTNLSIGQILKIK